jgi:hypothetical protein
MQHPMRINQGSRPKFLEKPAGTRVALLGANGGTMRTTLAILACIGLIGCAAEISGPSEPADVGERSQGLGEADLAGAVLGFANSASFADLDEVMNASAARSISDGRPFAALEALAAAPYVTDTVLRALLARVSPESAAEGAGFWEERLLDGRQAAAVLEMGNTAALNRLGCDLGFTSTMAQRIVDHRPYVNLDQLVDVPYFGANQLIRLKDNVDWWLDADAAATTLDCVSFSAAQEAAALRLANEGGRSQFCDLNACAFGGWGPQVTSIFEGRPWTNLAAISAIYGMGPVRMNMLRTRADKVIAGTLIPGRDTVSSLLNGSVASGYADVSVRFSSGAGAPGPAANKIGLFTHYACASIADPNDLTQTGVLCSGCWDSAFRDDWEGWAASGEPVNLSLRFYQDATWGLVIYQGTCPWN